MNFHIFYISWVFSNIIRAPHREMRRPIVFTLSVRLSVRQQFLLTPKLKIYTFYTAEILHTCFSPFADVHIEIWSNRGQYVAGNFISPWKFAYFENRTLWTLKLTTYTLYTADFLHTCFSPYTDEHIAIWFHFGENFIFQWKFRFCEHYNSKSINFT